MKDAPLALTYADLAAFLQRYGLQGEPYYLDDACRLRVGIRFPISGFRVALRIHGHSVLVCWLEREEALGPASLFRVLSFFRELARCPGVDDVRGYVDASGFTGAPGCADARQQRQLARIYVHHGATCEVDGDGYSVLIFRGAGRLRACSGIVT